MTKDNKKWLQGASRTQSGVNRPHLVPSQNAEKTQIIGRAHTVVFALPPIPFLPLTVFLSIRPDRSRVASTSGPGSPKELSPIVSERTLQLDQFNVRKREEGETLRPSVAGSGEGVSMEEGHQPPLFIHLSRGPKNQRNKHHWRNLFNDLKLSSLHLFKF